MTILKRSALVVGAGGTSRLFGVAVSGNYGFVVDRTTSPSTLRVIDVSDPDNPSEAGTLQDVAVNWGGGFVVEGSTLWVAGASGGGVNGARLSRIDISTPTSPSVTDTATTGSTGHAFCFDARRVPGTDYIATSIDRSTSSSDNGVLVWDTSTSPATPLTPLQSTAIVSFHGELAVLDSTHVVTSSYVSTRELVVWDISTNPPTTASVFDYNPSGTDNATAVVVRGSKIYAQRAAASSSTPEELVVIDASDPTSLSVDGYHAVIPDGQKTLNTRRAAALHGDLLVVGHTGPVVVDISGTPTLVDSGSGGEQAEGVEWSADGAYIYRVCQNMTFEIWEGIEVAGGGWVLGAVAIP